MDDIRKVIKTTSPPSVVIQTLRTALQMPPTAARNIVKDLTRPLNGQKRFIRKFDNEHWKGTLIMSEMVRCDDAIALQRLKKADIVIFEIHGGGFRVGHSTMYMDAFINWLRLMKSKHNLYACIMSVEYGLAPKHKYPGPLNDCIRAYDYLTKDLAVCPSKVVFSGDSAGGAFALETLMRTYTPDILDDLNSPRENYSIPIPAAVLLSSPLVSAETTSESWKLFHKKDMITLGLAKLIYKEYLGLPHVKVEDLPVMRLHHVRKDFDRFLPKNVMVFVGDKEVLRDDILDFAKAVKDDGKTNIQLIKEHYVHDWFMIREIVKKKDKKKLANYDELFVDFAVRAVKEAKAALLLSVPPTKEEFPLSEMLISDNTSINGDIPVQFSRPSQYKPNTILSEYAIITDHPKGVTA
ncbi:Alpha/Beta hydrolase protein [Mucor mucedo]|uniref:Alpha/Beta hydrolase protein n=1 Tax=Mucor mucedo TaxID=29922 RepID=UPI002220B7C0|nr:Alpha/Beta hydrolase protein [Mucor mucedo]KAI7890259.1 Alpha/Beta hydrolase protein [Mucor mucedo]